MDGDCYDFSPELQQLDSKIRPYVKPILNHEFGLLCLKAEINPPLEYVKMMMRNTPPCSDKFFLQVHYCKKPLIWRVMMNSSDLTQAPDFIMEENFILEMDADAEMIQKKVPSLANWCPSDENCLLNVVLELLDVYKDYQLQLLKDFHRFLFEYETLISMSQLDPSDVEVCISNGTRAPVVLFVVCIHLDFSPLPYFILTGDRPPVLLFVEFKDDCQSSIIIKLSAEVEEVLGTRYETPIYPPETPLMDYVPTVGEMLQNKVLAVAEGLKARRELFTHLFHFLERALLNGDTLTFRTASFLIRRSDFLSLLVIDVTNEFPKEKPRVTLSTVDKAKTVSKEYQDFPFSPRWPPGVIAKKLHQYVMDFAVKSFMDMSGEKKEKTTDKKDDNRKRGHASS